MASWILPSRAVICCSSQALPSGSLRSWRASDGDGDLSLCAALVEMAYGLGYFGKWVRAAHYGGEVAGLDFLTQRFDVRLTVG